MRKLLGPVILFCLFGLLAKIVIIDSTPDYLFFTDDAATSFAVGRAAVGGEIPLSGQPSHLRGRHLGPIYYYATALANLLAQGDPAAMCLIFSVFNLIAVAICCYLAHLLAPINAKMLAPIAALIFFLSPTALWVIEAPWVNNFLILPAALAMLSAYLTIAHGSRYLGFAIFAFSLCLQTFIGSIPLLAGLTVVTVHALFKNRSWRSAHIGWAALALLVWVPPLIYEFGIGHNIYRMLQAHTDASSAMSGIVAATSLLAEFFEQYFLALVSDRISGTTCLILCAALALLFGVSVRCLPGPAKKLLFGLELAVLFYLPALAKAQPPLHTFYLNALLPLLAILFALVLSFAWKVLQDRSLTVFSPQKPLALVAISFLGFVTYLNISASDDGLAAKAPNLVQTMLHAKEVARIINADRGQMTDLQVFVRGLQRNRADAIHYFMGPEFNQRMFYAKTFRELASFKKTAEIKSAYLLSCLDNPVQEEFARIEARMSAKWKVDRKISLENCSTCTGCELKRLIPIN